MAREAGLDNINMDMILGLPGEGVDEVYHTLNEIKAMRPESLTVHSLAIKRASRLNIFVSSTQSFQSRTQTVLSR